MAATSALPPALPTPRQMHDLAARVPPNPLPPPPPSLLHPFMAVLSTPWLRDFLLCPDALHVSPLSSAHLPYTAFTCSLSATRVEPPSPAPRHTEPETHHLRNRYLFTPLVAAAGATAGVGVMDCALHVAPPSAPTDWHLACTRALVFRFVRTARAHVELYDVPDHDAVLLFTTVSLSPTRTRAATCLLHRSVLHDALDNAPDRAPSRTALTAALQFAQHDEQCHACMCCGSSPNSRCACILPPPGSDPPRHPLDAAHFRRSMRRHLGEFHSVANKLFFARGCAPRPVAMGCRVALASLEDPAFVRDAARWAVSDALRRMPPPDPRTGPVSHLWLEDDKEEGADPAADEHALIAHFLTEPTDTTASPNSTVPDVPPVEPVSLELATDTLVSATGAIVAKDVPKYPSESFEVEDWWIAHSKRGAPALPTSLCPSPPVLGADVEADAATRVSGASDASGASGTSGIFGRKLHAGACAGDAWEVQPLVHGHANVEGEAEVEEEAEVEVEATAVVVEAGAEADAEAGRLAERQARAAARRERNRIAARRSNLRRKAARDGLVERLHDAKRRVEQLREAEMRLRRNNLQLRALAEDLRR